LTWKIKTKSGGIYALAEDKNALNRDELAKELSKRIYNRNSSEVWAAIPRLGGVLFSEIEAFWWEE
jgi:Fe-S cluster biosynthesis and repair protein YggX